MEYTGVALNRFIRHVFVLFLDLKALVISLVHKVEILQECWHVIQKYMDDLYAFLIHYLTQYKVHVHSML